MKVSIITVCYNSEKTIQHTIESVLAQDYLDIEYILVDGNSKDKTLDIINKYPNKIAKIISEPDKGIYDAMNKGLALASGDIIGIINSDDFYDNNFVISDIVNEFQTKGVDSVYADLVFINSESPDKIVRYYNSANFNPKKLAYGWMPAHPTFFVRKEIYNKFGLFKLDYKIASDYEIIARFLGKEKISYSHLPKVIIKMRTGGVSTRNFKSTLIINHEILRACAENGIRTNLLKVYSKYFSKVFQLIRRPS